MSNALLAFLGGMGSGYLAQKDRNVELERQARQDAQAAELHNARMDEINLAKKNQAALTAAGQAATVNENAATLDTGAGAKVYDMAGGADIAASDARQFNLHPLPITAAADAAPDAPDPVAAPRAVTGSTYSVNGVGYDKAAGIKAAADFNSPDAVNARTAQALRATGRPMEAMQLESAAKTAKLSDLQLADAKWKSDIGKAMAAGHEGIADLVSRSQADGLAEHKLKAVKNADGTVTYNKVGQDGTLMPIPALTFKDDYDGAVKAGFALDRMVTPEQRLSHMNTEKATKLAEDQWNKKFQQDDRHFDAQMAMHKLTAGIASGQLELAKHEDKRKQIAFDLESKVPVAVKTAYTPLQESAKIIDQALAKGAVDGNLRMDDPNVQALVNKRLQLSLQMAELLKPYLYDTPTAGADPGAIRTPAPAAPAAPAPKPKMTAADMAKKARGMNQPVAP